MDISKMLQQANKMKQELDKKEKAFDEQIFTYEKQGIKFIGPSSEMIELMGNKSKAKR